MPDKSLQEQPPLPAETVFTVDVLDSLEVIIHPKVEHPEILPPESIDNKGDSK